MGDRPRGRKESEARPNCKGPGRCPRATVTVSPTGSEPRTDTSRGTAWAPASHRAAGDVPPAVRWVDAHRVRLHVALPPVRHRHVHERPVAAVHAADERVDLRGRRDRRAQLGARLRARGPLAHPTGLARRLRGGSARDRRLRRRRRLRAARVRPLRPLEGRGVGGRDLDRGHVRRPPDAVPAGGRQARRGHDAHRAARAHARRCATPCATSPPTPTT